MSAIFGFFGDGDVSLLREMGIRLHHRGTVMHTWCPAPSVFFGQWDFSDAGGSNAPSETSLAVDATIYNAHDLASQLQRRGQYWQVGTDQELIQKAFEKFGPECFAMFNGDFAIALWDERTRRLVLARDALGARALYYYYGPRRVAFASEYKALLALSDFEARPNLVALQHLQRAKYLPPGCTLLEGVRIVSAAHWVEADRKHVVEHRYWDPIINPQPISMVAAEQRLRELFLQAVSKRVEGRGRLGAELSSGIDSAAVVAAMRQARPDESIKTFTIGAGPDDPEILGARRVAEHLQTDHREIFAGPECLSDVMPAVIWHLEDPIARTETVLYYQMMKVASEHIDVVLGGYASDGLYAGMPKHKLVKMMQVTPIGRQAIEEFYHYTQMSEPPQSVLGRLAKRLYFGGNELLAPAILGAPSAVSPSPLLKRRQGLLNEVLRDGIRYGVPGWLPKAEKTHAAHGVELRSPFTDLDLVRFAFELPEHFKLRGLKEKFILRRALAPLLPREVVNRPKFPQRMGYSLKLSDVLDAMADQLLRPGDLRQRGFFDPATLDALRRRVPGKPYGFNRAMQLWTVIATELWARLFLDQRAACPIPGSVGQMLASIEVLGARTHIQRYP